MPDPKTTSTLELVINEQQAPHNMSHVDLSRPELHGATAGTTADQQQTSDGFLGRLRRWPAAFRDSFSAKLNDAKSKSETKTEFAFEVVNEFSSVIIWIICFLCTITVPIFLFFIGLINLDNCSARPSLPYLIFSIGFLMTASNLFNLAIALDLPILTNHRSLSSDVKNIISSVINVVFNCFVVFLFILSAYMVYNLQATTDKQPDNVSPSTTEQPATFTTASIEDQAPPFEQQETNLLNCGATLYSFSFWFITLTLGIFIVLSLFAMILMAYNRYRIAIIKGSMPRSQAHPNLSSGQPIEVNHTTTNRF